MFAFWCSGFVSNESFKGDKMFTVIVKGLKHAKSPLGSFVALGLTGASQKLVICLALLFSAMDVR